MRPLYRNTLWQRACRRFINPKKDRFFLRKIDPDLVVISEGDLFEAREWLCLLIKTGIPYLTVTNACTPWLWPRDSEFSGLREAYLGARRLFFVSRENLDFFKMMMGAPSLEAEVVRNPFKVDYDQVAPWNEGASLRWACIATADPDRKGQDLLFRVMSSAKWRARNLQIDLFCHGGRCHQVLLNMKQQFAVDNIHIVTEHQSDISAIWRHRSALILPSRREGLPLVAVEAMLSGRLCIVTDLGWNTEVIRDNETGFVASAPTVLALDEAMERAWARRDDWQRMGKIAGEAIRKIIPRHPEDIFADKLLSFI
jgi:glycosyltransferase involved in cell wall biosynthesis